MNTLIISTFSCTFEEFKNDTNVQELIVDKGYGTIYKRYADQCEWTQ